MVVRSLQIIFLTRNAALFARKGQLLREHDRMGYFGYLHHHSAFKVDLEYDLWLNEAAGKQLTTRKRPALST